MFWTDNGGRDKAGKVERAAMDGTGRKSLVHRSDVWRPLGIALDYTEEKVYWLEDSRWILWKMDLDGGKTFFVQCLAQQCEFNPNRVRTDLSSSCLTL